MSGSAPQTISNTKSSSPLFYQRKERNCISSHPSHRRLTEYSTTAPVNYEISELLSLASLSCMIISNHHKARGRKYSILLRCQLFISMSAHTNGVPTLSQLAESGLITTWQTCPSPCTKGRCHFINLLWPHQRVNSPSKMEKRKKKTCHYRRHIIRVSVCLFSCHLLLPPFMNCRQRRLMGFLTEKQGTNKRGKKEEWKHNQWWWFHWLFIIR